MKRLMLFIIVLFYSQLMCYPATPSNMNIPMFEELSNSEKTTALLCWDNIEDSVKFRHNQIILSNNEDTFKLVKEYTSIQIDTIHLIKYDTLTHRNVYTYVEKMPKYKGGDKDLLNDFGNNFQFEFKESEYLQTRLHVQFVINKDGCLIGARICNKKDEELTRFEEEVLKTFRLLQNWESGKHNGKNVDVMLTMPINIDFRNQ